MKAGLILLTALLGCSQQPATVANVVDRSGPGSRDTGDLLPAAMTGRWAVSRDQCAAGSEQGITVEPIRIRFAEARAEITRVTALDDGTYGVDAQVSGEGQTESRSFDLKLLDGGRRLIRVEAPIPDIIYTRCKA